MRPLRFPWMFVSALLSLCLAQGTSPGQETPPVVDEYADLSHFLRELAVKRIPKEFEDRSRWGQTIPVPDKLRLPKLRTYVKENDEWRVPHGPWIELKGRIDDPKRDVVLTVKAFEQVDDKNFKLELEGGSPLDLHIHWQQWQKGLMLLAVQTDAQATVAFHAKVDVATQLLLTKFPPEVELKPKVSDLTVELQDFTLKPPLPFFQGEKGGELRNVVKDLLRQAVRSQEGSIRDEVNKVLAANLKDGKGTVSAGAILKALPKPKKNGP